MSNVFYIPGETAVIDYARQLTCGAWVSQYNGTPLPLLARRYPGAVLGSVDDFLTAQDREHGTLPREISVSRFDLLLTQRRTIGFSSDPEGESFKIDTPCVGNMTSIYLKMADRCWVFVGLATLPHKVIVQRVKDFRNGLRSTH